MINFFRRFRKKKPEQRKEFVYIEDSEEKIKELLLKIREKEQQLLNDIRNRIEILNKDLSEQIIILKGINLEKRKEEARLKERVLNSKENYIEHCEKLIREISFLKKEDIEDLFKSLNRISFKFEKNSHKSFEIATILIGKEIARIRGVVKSFFRNQEKLYLKNKEMFLKKKIVKEILYKKNALENLKKLKDEIKKELEELEDFSRKNVYLIKKQEEEIDNFNKSERFKNYLEQEKKNKKKKEELRKSADKLRDNIDLKELLNIHHQNKLFLELIRKYKSNFFKAMVEDTENAFSKIIPDEINKEILQIKKGINEMNEKGETEVKKEEQNLKKELIELNEEILKINEKKDEAKKRLEKINEKINELKREIRKELEKIGFEAEKV